MVKNGVVFVASILSITVINFLRSMIEICGHSVESLSLFVSETAWHERWGGRDMRRAPLAQPAVVALAFSLLLRLVNAGNYNILRILYLYMRHIELKVAKTTQAIISYNKKKSI